MSDYSQRIGIASLVIFGVATSVAWAIIKNANPYSGANYGLAAFGSCPVYFLGVLAAIVHLRRISSKSALGWAALILNLVPFGYTALLVGVVVTGNW